jgi:hypothetical protein
MMQSMKQHIGGLLGEARHVIDSLLMEMPRYVIPGTLKRMDDPENENLLSDSDESYFFDIRVIPDSNLVNKIIVLPKKGGYTEVTTIPVDPPFEYNYDNRPELLQKYRPEIEAAKKKLMDRQAAGRRRLKRNRELEVPMDRPETIRLGSGTNPIAMMSQSGFNKKFRWTSGGQNPTNRSDTVLSFFRQAAKPGDKLVKLISDEINKKAVYVLLSPEEEQEFYNMLTMRARRKVEKALGEASLSEMARHMFPAAQGNSKITYNFKAEWFNSKFRFVATAILRSGEETKFFNEEPMSEADREVVMSSDKSESDPQWATLFKDVFDRLYKKTIGKAKAYIEASDSPPVLMHDDIIKFRVKADMLPILSKYRYVSEVGLFGGDLSFEEMAKFMEYRQPGDRLVKVIEDVSSEVPDKVYFVLASPQELENLEREITLLKRDAVSKLLDTE